MRRRELKRALFWSAILLGLLLFAAAGVILRVATPALRGGRRLLSSALHRGRQANALADRLDSGGQLLLVLACVEMTTAWRHELHGAPKGFAAPGD